MASDPAPDPTVVAALHPALAPVAFLLGTWNGRGEGHYPTIEPFAYTEVATYSHDGRPFLFYEQRTHTTLDGRPLHSESGYLRCPQPGIVELVLAHPSGIVKVCEGTVAGLTIELLSRSISTTSSAKQVSTLARRLWIDDGALCYTLAMAAVATPLAPHLAARLARA